MNERCENAFTRMSLIDLYTTKLDLLKPVSKRLSNLVALITSRSTEFVSNWHVAG